MENSKRKRKSINLSASTISDYLQCPRKVFYRIYLPQAAVRSDALILGSLVHDTLEKYWDDILEATSYINSADVPDKIKKDALQMVTNYFRMFRPLVEDNDDVEKFVKFVVNDVPFVAKLDRIKSDSVIDWKTSRKSKGNGTDTDIQAIIYEKAFEEYKGYLPDKVMFINLRNGDISHADINSDYKNHFWNEIVPYVLDGIKSERFPATGWYQYFSPCRFCQYKEVCELDVKKNFIYTETL